MAAAAAAAVSAAVTHVVAVAGRGGSKLSRPALDWEPGQSCMPYILSRRPRTRPAVTRHLGCKHLKTEKKAMCLRGMAHSPAGGQGRDRGLAAPQPRTALRTHRRSSTGRDDSLETGAGVEGGEEGAERACTQRPV